MDRDLENQLWLENEYAKKHVHRLIIQEMKDTPETYSMLRHAEDILLRWAQSYSDYDSKAARKAALLDKYDLEDGLDLSPAVEHVVACVVRSGYTTLNNIAMMCLNLGGEDLSERQQMDLACEAISMIADSDLYDIRKPNTLIMVKSCVVLSEALRDHIDHTTYIPPLVIPPKHLTRNNATPYYSYMGESLILGSKFNYHSEDICLDVINTQNQVPLALSMDFMACYTEPEPNHTEKAAEKGKSLLPEELLMAQINWAKYQKQCKFFAHLLNRLGNRIYLGNKVDKRGRLYCSGYHVSPQGSSYRKAIVELADAEMVEVPSQYCI